MRELKQALEHFGCDSSEDILHKFSFYMDYILRWNQSINLTAITEPGEFVRKHFIDSLCCVSYPQFQNAASVIDVGTGAGFPGLPLAIIAPEKSFLLIDSLNKRIRLLNDLISELHLKNVVAVHGRAEELAHQKEYRENFDLCISRAVSRLSVLSEYCLPFIKKGGFLAAYKGPDAHTEIHDAHTAFGKLGGKVSEIASTEMEQYDIHHFIVFIHKTMNTPKQYPRRAGIPQKNPL